MERLLTIQKRKNLNEVYRIGEKGPGGEYHDYAIMSAENHDILATIVHQKGPRNEPKSRHGVLDSDLLEIVRDRLECFQKGGYACNENGHALLHVECALMWLNRRVEDRIEREVLGTMEK